MQLSQNSLCSVFMYLTEGSALRVTGLETQHIAVALADVAATVARPVQDLVRRHDREAVGTWSYARPPPTVVAQIGRRRPAVAGGIVRRLGVAAGAADVGPIPILIHIMVLGMAMATLALSIVEVPAILGLARLGEEEARQHTERERDECEQGARAPP
jgi:hypothetical protein